MGKKWNIFVVVISMLFGLSVEKKGFLFQKVTCEVLQCGEGATCVEGGEDEPARCKALSCLSDYACPGNETCVVLEQECDEEDECEQFFCMKECLMCGPTVPDCLPECQDCEYIEQTCQSCKQAICRD